MPRQSRTDAPGALGEDDFGRTIIYQTLIMVWVFLAGYAFI